MARGRNPDQAKCPGCRGFVKKDAERCARCGMIFDEGGNSGKDEHDASEKSAGKEEAKKGRRIRKQERINTRPDDTPADRADERSATQSGRRGFFKWSAR